MAEWTVLGAGSILPRAGYGCSGYALRARPGGRVTLFDCGPGSIRALAGAGIALEELERVVISHFHLDHCLDLFALAFARNNPSFQPPSLELVGPIGLARLLERAEGTLGRWARDPRARIEEVSAEVGRDGRLEREGLVLSCVPTGHTPEALAWRVDLADGSSAAYTGDSGENPAVARLARDVDLFVVECSFPDERAVPGHLTPSGAGRMAQRSECRRLLLTHFYPAVDPEQARARAAQIYRGPIELARDGSRHVFPAPA